MSIYCFDLDEVLVKGDVIIEASRRCLVDGLIDKIYTGSDMTNWNLSGLPECVKDETRKLFRDPKFAVWKKKPIVGVQMMLEYLRLKNHTVNIITARPKEIHEDTYKYVNSIFHNLVKETICVDPNIQSKLPLLAKMNPDYYFDDNIKNCEDAISLGIKTYLITNDHTGWNQIRTDKNIKILKNIAFLPIIETTED